MSDLAAKRIFTELNKVNLENQKNPNSRTFIIDENPFNTEDGESPALEEDGTDQYYVVIGRILPTSSPYNRSAYKAKLKIPTTYPIKPPQFQIITPMYHPNIGPEGK
jgi:ubiquitin-protein ligase